MARMMIEYFKPQPDEPGTFPLGLIVQDDHKVFYWRLHKARFRFEKFPDFALEVRDEIVQRNLLMPMYRTVTGDYIAATDPEFLVRLAEDGTGHFRYGRIWAVQGMTAEELSRILKDNEGEDELLEILEKKDYEPAKELERQIG